MTEGDQECLSSLSNGALERQVRSMKQEVKLWTMTPSFFLFEFGHIRGYGYNRWNWLGQHYVKWEEACAQGGEQVPQVSSPRYFGSEFKHMKKYIYSWKTLNELF